MITAAGRPNILNPRVPMKLAGFYARGQPSSSSHQPPVKENIRKNWADGKTPEFPVISARFVVGLTTLTKTMAGFFERPASAGRWSSPIGHSSRRLA
jgi:hypothetical protein